MCAVTGDYPEHNATRTCGVREEGVGGKVQMRRNVPECTLC